MTVTSIFLGWELLVYFNVFYKLRRLIADPGEYREFQTPVFPTVYPYWFAKSTTNSNFVVPPPNKVSTAAFDLSTYELYQQNFRNLYGDWEDEWERRFPGAPVEAFILDEYRGKWPNSKPPVDRKPKLEFIASYVVAAWEDLSPIGPSAYPVKSLQNVFYGASQLPPLAREEIRYYLVESRRPQLKDGTVRIRRSGGTGITTLRDNGSRVASTLLRKPETRVDVPPWDARSFGDTTVFVPTSTLSGSLPNGKSALTNTTAFLSGDEEPDEESDSEDGADPDGGLVQEFKLPPSPVFNAATLEPGFYYCSSRVPGEPGPGVTVYNLPSGTDLDAFTSALHSGVVALVSVPTLTQPQNFLGSDEWNVWWQAALKSSSLFAFGDDTSISSFGTIIQFGAYTLTFNTTSIAVNFPPPSNPMFKSLVIDKNITILGLSPESNGSKPMDFDLSDVYSALGINDAPKISLKVTLDPNVQKMRNAIWFRPELNYMTKLRLVFTINKDTLSNLNEFFQAFKFEVASGSVIGVKTCNWLWDGKNSTSASLAYSLTFNITGFKEPVIGALVFKSEFTQFFIDCGDNGWDSWVTWLLSILGLGSTDFTSWFHSILDSGSIPQPRRLQFSLDASHNIQDCQFDFEISLGVGKSGSSDNPVVLLTFFWSQATGIEISGSLWTGVYPPISVRFATVYRITLGRVTLALVSTTLGSIHSQNAREACSIAEPEAPFILQSLMSSMPVQVGARLRVTLCAVNDTPENFTHQQKVNHTQPQITSTFRAMRHTTISP